MCLWCLGWNPKWFFFFFFFFFFFCRKLFQLEGNNNNLLHTCIKTRGKRRETGREMTVQSSVWGWTEHKQKEPTNTDSLALLWVRWTCRSPTMVTTISFSGRTGKARLQHAVLQGLLEWRLWRPGSQSRSGANKQSWHCKCAPEFSFLNLFPLTDRLHSLPAIWKPPFSQLCALPFSLKLTFFCLCFKADQGEHTIHQHGWFLHLIALLFNRPHGKSIAAPS